MIKHFATTVFTTSIKPSKTIFFILNDLKNIFPHSVYLKRKNYKIRQIIAYLKLKEIKNLVLLSENYKKKIQLWHIDLDNNFLVKYEIVSIILRNNIEKCAKISSHRPELFFDNFKGSLDWVLGTMMKRFFISLPDFKGRQILCFHKRKNFLFIRFHRYIFSLTGKDVKLQELGPKITLKFENFFSLVKFINEFF